MPEDPVLYHQEDGIGVLTLNNPDQRNVLVHAGPQPAAPLPDRSGRRFRG